MRVLSGHSLLSRFCPARLPWPRTKTISCTSALIPGFKYVRRSKTGRGRKSQQGDLCQPLPRGHWRTRRAQLAAEMVNPSFLTISPNHRFLYAVSEDPYSVGPPLDHASYVSAFAIDSALASFDCLNTVPASGTSTCFISMDKTGKYVLMANFGSGSVSVVRVKADGSLGELASFIQDVGHSVDPSIQTEPHPHSILSFGQTIVMPSSLTLVPDKVLIFRFDCQHRNALAAGTSVGKCLSRRRAAPFRLRSCGKIRLPVERDEWVVDVLALDSSKGTLTAVQRAQTMPHDFFGINHSGEIESSSQRKIPLRVESPHLQ